MAELILGSQHNLYDLCYLKLSFNDEIACEPLSDAFYALRYIPDSVMFRNEILAERSLLTCAIFVLNR